MLVFRALLGWVAFFTTAVAAQTPAALRDWVPWVLKDLDYRACPFLANDKPDRAEAFVCIWPGRLDLAIGPEGAAFAVRWRVEAPSFVPLPGDLGHWPQQVMVNGQRGVVLNHDTWPCLWLMPGSYQVSGRIPWHERPHSLRVPARIGWIALRVDGDPVVPIERDGEDLVLGRGSQPVSEADGLRMRVYRKLSDGIPASLTTRLEIEVAGRAREESFAPVLPEGFAPVGLTSVWPARLDADGRLRVQVQAGRQTVTIEARATGPLVTAVARLPPAPWPQQEIWSYAPEPETRVTVARGPTPVDPRQAGVPAEWHDWAAFALSDGVSLRIEERSRGLAADEGNRLTLAREAWLAFDGDAWYARDRITGTMRRGWRLDVALPLTLERAEAMTMRPMAAAGEPLLITRGAEPGQTGVEWRAPDVHLAAGLRIDAVAALPVTGWQDTFDHVDTTLHLPFGYRLLAAPGADRARGAWLSAWTLLDVFVCALLVLLAGRRFGWIGGVVASLYLLLGYQDAGAPFASLISALAFGFVAESLPTGKLRVAARTLARVALGVACVVALPFAAIELRGALYPQLEPVGSVAFGDTKLASRLPPPKVRQESTAPAEPPKVLQALPRATTPPPANTAGIAEAGAEAVATAPSAKSSERYAESTVIQTGSGAPSWTLGSTASLHWSGPVPATSRVQLVIAPPWLTRLARIAVVALLGWLLAGLLRSAAMRRPSAAGRSGAVLLLLGSLLAPTARAAEFPPAALLDELRQRLTELPRCAPTCASLAEVEIGATGDSIAFALEAQAAERIALPLPNPGAGAMLKSIQVDGLVEESLARDQSGTTWLTLGRGVHRIDLEFTAYADQIGFAFPLRPARLSFHGSGWTAQGLGDETLLAETLSLTRVRQLGAPHEGTETQSFQPYVRVTRTLVLAREWTVDTEVTRLAPAQGGFTVTVPVLAGEHVTRGGAKVEKGDLPVSFADGQDVVSWSGTLDKTETLRLTAPSLVARVEVWRVRVGPMWHADFRGVPQVGGTDDVAASEDHEFEFRPLPGETLVIAMHQPMVAPGATRAIDAARLVSEAGRHSAMHHIKLTLRAGQAGEHLIELPRDAELLAVRRDGETFHLRPQDGKLALPLIPGSQRFEIDFRQTTPLATWIRTPAIALGLPVANLEITLRVPPDRWLLATFGPGVGPAVLYWSELAVLVLVAALLARSGRTRLKFHHWLLLGLGFSTFSWPAWLAVVLWLLAFDWRARWAPVGPRMFNLMQIGLVLLTVIALGCLLAAIPAGLLGQPSMHVTGNGSTAKALVWFLDRSAGELPRASALTVPLYVYKAVMLAWALWLAQAVLGWLREAFLAWTKGGYWRPWTPPSPGS